MFTIRHYAFTFNSFSLVYIFIKKQRLDFSLFLVKRKYIQKEFEIFEEIINLPLSTSI